MAFLLRSVARLSSRIVPATNEASSLVHLRPSDSSRSSTYSSRRPRFPFSFGVGLLSATILGGSLLADDRKSEAMSFIPFTLSRADALQRIKGQMSSAWVASPAAVVAELESSLTSVFVPAYVIKVMSEVNARASVAVVHGNAAHTTWRTTTIDSAPREHEVVVFATNSFQVRDGLALSEAELEEAGPWPVKAASTAQDIAGMATVLPVRISAAAAWDSIGRAQLEHMLTETMRSAAAAQSTTGEVADLQVRFTHGIPHASTVLLPVWVAQYVDKQSGEKHVFVVNGYEGTVVGEAPVSIPTVAFAAVMSAVAVGSLAYAVTHPVEESS